MTNLLWQDDFVKMKHNFKIHYSSYGLSLLFSFCFIGKIKKMTPSYRKHKRWYFDSNNTIYIFQHTTEKDDVQQKAQHHQGVKTTETKVTRATEKETSPHVKPRIQIQPGATCSAKISPKPTSSEPITSHSAPRGSIKHGKTLIQQMVK